MKPGTFLALFSAIPILLFSEALPAETADDVNCVQCVNQADIAFGAVGTGRLRRGAVNESRLADDAVSMEKIQDSAVDWQKLAVSLQDRILQLEDAMAALQSEVQEARNELDTNTVLDLDGYLALDTTDAAKPTARFAGVNVQVVNGIGSMEDNPNGLGNLIVGYDLPYTPRDEDDYVCSSGYFHTQEECEIEGFVWAQHHKSGSHNLLVGYGHRYSWLNGIAGGRNNTINNKSASVIGAQGGFATGQHSIVVGGGGNRATGTSSAVIGGWNNWATDRAARVTGGVHNTAIGQASTVSGGSGNTTNGHASTISGGRDNIANGEAATVSGGFERSAEGELDWAAGSLWEDE
jgi:hypothetical protein